MFNHATVVLFIALGIFLATRRPRTRVSVAFSVFAISFGLWVSLWYVFTFDDPRAVLTVVGRGIPAGVGAIALAVVAVSFPRPLAPDERRLLIVPVVVALVYFAAGVYALYRSLALWAVVIPVMAPYPELGALGTFGAQALFAVVFGSSILFALRFARTAPHEAAARRQYALLAASVLFYFGFVSGAGQIPAVSILSRGWPWMQLQNIAMLLAMAIICVIWLWATTKHDAAFARNVALLCAGLPLSGLLTSAYIDSGAYGFGYGALRIVAIVTFSYALLRAQLFDIDIKLKWTVRRGTVAAAFVGVFFVVSEGAQTFLSAQMGPVAGLLAAGGLVFAIAPLQRAADSLADRAMPGVVDNAEYRLVRKYEVYRAAVDSALVEGDISPKERGMLATFASELGLTPKEMHDVEREARAARAGVM